MDRDRQEERPDLDKLEALLHYFHVTCQPAVADMDPDRRALLLASVTCVAADVFINCKRSDRLTAVLLDATKKYDDEIQEHVKETEGARPVPENSWMIFAAVAAKAKSPAQAKADAAAHLLPKVIKYDEATGKPLDAQNTRADEGTPPRAFAGVPWQEWLRSEVAQGLDRDTNAIAAITMVLRSLHYHGKVDDQAVTVVLDLESKVKITKAGADLQPGDLQLPPCIPASGKIHTTSTHPYRVAINVTQRAEELS